MTQLGAGALPLTVGILSHKRPHLLPRVLIALAQQDLAAFEVVVAGDLPTLEAFDLPGDLALGVRYLHVTEPNVSHARNCVIAAAGGDIVAFCDDDAVPEPDWLRRVAEPFANPKVGAVGGLVRARDGLEVEWRGVTFDRSAREFALDAAQGIQVMGSAEQCATARFGGLMGANSAFRRAAVVAVGGFDEAYRYFLDETDMALRLAEAGWDMAVTDRAEVHHLREVNAVRGHLKKPRNLREVAASKAFFCEQHLDPAAIEPELARFRARRDADCDGFIRIGAMRGVERDRLLSQVDDGLAEGRLRTTRRYDGSWDRPTYAPWPGATRAAADLNIALYCGWGFGRGRRLIRLAERLVAAGHRVSVFRFQTGFAAHAVEFRRGIWHHEGGTWRFDHREDGRPVILRHHRVAAEIARVAQRRNFHLRLDPVLRGGQHVLRLPGVPSLSITPMRRDLDLAAVRDRLAVDSGAPPTPVSDGTHRGPVPSDLTRTVPSVLK
ncbi:MAG: glycosyltransferase [Pseudomonadota bacterium]